MMWRIQSKVKDSNLRSIDDNKYSSLLKKKNLEEDEELKDNDSPY
jgi:hypothetical protein